MSVWCVYPSLPSFLFLSSLPSFINSLPFLPSPLLPLRYPISPLADDNMKIMTKERCVQDVCAAVATHGDCKDLVDAACSALCSLSVDGMYFALTGGMWRNTDTPPILDHVPFVLSGSLVA